MENRLRLSRPIPEIRALTDRVDEAVQAAREALGEASVAAALEVVEVACRLRAVLGQGPRGHC